MKSLLQRACMCILNAQIQSTVTIAQEMKDDIGSRTWDESHYYIEFSFLSEFARTVCATVDDELFRRTVTKNRRIVTTLYGERRQKNNLKMQIIDHRIIAIEMQISSATRYVRFTISVSKYRTSHRQKFNQYFTGLAPLLSRPEGSD